MGNKQGKPSEKHYLPDSAFEMAQYPEGASEKFKTFVDPRSPNVFRTPLKEMPSFQQATPVTVGDSTVGVLRRRFLKGFTYNLNDPRSPTVQLDRTPLFFDENEKTLNLNDTFADLFIESTTTATAESTRTVTVADNADEARMEAIENISAVSISTSVSTSVESASVRGKQDSAAQNLTSLPGTGTAITVQLDPRSPSIGVERTPIIFADDNEANEDAMLEEVLAKLSLNMSSGSGCDSVYATPTAVEKGTHSQYRKKLTNKRVEHLRMRQQRRTSERIYQDTENMSPNTPVKELSLKMQLPRPDSTSKRTPLRCIKNRTISRSRSVEPVAKYSKMQITLNTSVDDNLEPVLHNIHIIQ